MGKAVYDAGHGSGMTDAARRRVEELGVLLKGPMETPKGGGVKSINVTARKMWSAYANKRTFRTLPGVDTVFSRAGLDVDLVLVRENIEDTYGGVEHMLTHDVAMCRRFTTRPGSLRVHRYAFELARRTNRRRVTCGHKANIMKLTDGLFLSCFREVAAEFPDIEADDAIVDDLAMKLVTRPDKFDVLVLPNLQGDILSDLCAGLVGGLGFAPSANIGDHVCIFEAVHGTAPDIAGMGIANPTALLLSATMLLRHVGLADHASLVEEGLSRVLAAGVHTRDFGFGAASVGTHQFVDRVCDAIREARGRLTSPLRSMSGARQAAPTEQLLPRPRMLTSPRTAHQRLAGVDVFVESELDPAALAESLLPVVPAGFALTMISNRGTQVWPTGSRFTDCVDQYRVRFESSTASPSDVFALAAGVDPIARVCSTEMLLSFGGRAGYSLAQGQ